MPRFELKVCACEPGTLRTSAGFTIDAPHGLQAMGRAGIVIVPSWHDDGRAPPEALSRALRAAQRRGALIVGLCLGAFVLAEAGLLETSQRSIEEVAQAAGFGSAVSLRQHFAAALPTSPSAYRREFRGHAGAG